SLLKQGFNKQDLRRSGSDIFGDTGALDSSLANFSAWSVLSFGLFGGSSETLNMLNSSVFACMEGVSLLSSEEFGRKQGQKSDMYPEGRCHFLIGTKEDMSGLCLISARHMRRCGSRDKAKLTSAHK